MSTGKMLGVAVYNRILVEPQLTGVIIIIIIIIIAVLLNMIYYPVTLFVVT
jgi:hypothetical protein